jgi:hypothetical protein
VVVYPGITIAYFLQVFKVDRRNGADLTRQWLMSLMLYESSEFIHFSQHRIQVLPMMLDSNVAQDTP